MFYKICAATQRSAASQIMFCYCRSDWQQTNTEDESALALTAYTKQNPDICSKSSHPSILSDLYKSLFEGPSISIYGKTLTHIDQTPCTKVFLTQIFDLLKFFLLALDKIQYINFLLPALDTNQYMYMLPFNL